MVKIHKRGGLLNKKTCLFLFIFPSFGASPIETHVFGASIINKEERTQTGRTRTQRSINDFPTYFVGSITMRKILALTLALVCVAGLSLGCKPAAKDAPATDAPAAEATADEAAADEAVEEAAPAADEAAEVVEEAAPAADAE